MKKKQLTGLMILSVWICIFFLILASAYNTRVMIMTKLSMGNDQTYYEKYGEHLETNFESDITGIKIIQTTPSGEIFEQFKTYNAMTLGMGGLILLNLIGLVAIFYEKAPKVE